jgi:hypothetical protein
LRWPYLAGHKKARKLLYLRALKNGGQTQNRTGDSIQTYSLPAYARLTRIK